MNKCTDLDMHIQLIAQHDYEALEALYEELADSIYRFSLMILHDSHLAEDAMQTTFMKIMANAKLYKPKTNPKAWIFAIARNVCMDICRAKIPVCDGNMLDSLSDNCVIDDLVDLIYVRDAVKKLTTIERDILSLYIFAGLKQIEISKIMNIPYVKVRSHYKYAIQKLRKDFGDQVDG